MNTLRLRNCLIQLLSSLATMEVTESEDHTSKSDVVTWRMSIDGKTMFVLSRMTPKR